MPAVDEALVSHARRVFPFWLHGFSWVKHDVVVVHLDMPPWMNVNDEETHHNTNLNIHTTRLVPPFLIRSQSFRRHRFAEFAVRFLLVSRLVLYDS